MKDDDIKRIANAAELMALTAILQGHPRCGSCQDFATNEYKASFCSPNEACDACSPKMGERLAETCRWWKEYEVIHPPPTPAHAATLSGPYQLQHARIVRRFYALLKGEL